MEKLRMDPEYNQNAIEVIVNQRYEEYSQQSEEERSGVDLESVHETVIDCRKTKFKGPASFFGSDERLRRCLD
jgi:hypothetical protein